MEWGAEGGYHQGHVENLPRGEGDVSVNSQRNLYGEVSSFDSLWALSLSKDTKEIQKETSYGHHVPVPVFSEGVPRERGVNFAISFERDTAKRESNDDTSTQRLHFIVGLQCAKRVPSAPKGHSCAKQVSSASNGQAC